MTPIEVRSCGGTILHPLLHGIAHNFFDDDSRARRFLEVLIAAEDALLASGDLQSDYVVAVFAKRVRQTIIPPSSAPEG